MVSNSEGELSALLGPGPAFHIAMRGYDKGQVDSYLIRSESELTTAQAARDHAVKAHASIGTQLSSCQADVKKLRRELADSAANSEPAKISDRIRDILQLAADEADDTRAAGVADAEKQLAQAKVNAANSAVPVLEKAKADAERIVHDALGERDRLGAEARTARDKADYVSAERRAAAAGEAEKHLAVAKTAAEATQAAIAELEQVRAEAKRAAATAVTERERLGTEAEKARAKADYISAERRTLAENQARKEHEDARAATEALVAAGREQIKKLNSQRDATFAGLEQLQDKLRVVIGVAKQDAAKQSTTGPA
jgi:cell division septum initiation protein DivIVA